VTRRVSVVPLLIVLPVLVAWAGQATFKTGITLVRVDVSVTRGAIPVSGLTEANFEVRDNGIRQRIERVLVDEVPLSVLLVLDASDSVAGRQLGHLQTAARAFLDGLVPRDRAGLLTFSHQLMLRQALTSDLLAVRKAVDETVGTGSTALNDAIYAALRLRRPSSDRGVAVVFSDGLDNMSWLTDEEIVAAARRSDLIAYGVTLSADGPPSFAGRAWRPTENALLRSLADQTGGRLFNVGSSGQLPAVFVRALQEIRARYVLTYYPQGVEQQGWHKLDVRLERASGEVRARPGYVAPGQGPQGK
jgi:VWFA-related protein